MLDVELTLKITLAPRRAGATKADLEKLSEGNTQLLILAVPEGDCRVTIINRNVGPDTDPLDPKARQNAASPSQARGNPRKITNENIFATYNAMKEEYGSKRITKAMLAKRIGINGNTLKSRIRRGKIPIRFDGGAAPADDVAASSTPESPNTSP